MAKVVTTEQVLGLHCSLAPRRPLRTNQLVGPTLSGGRRRQQITIPLSFRLCEPSWRETALARDWARGWERHHEEMLSATDPFCVYWFFMAHLSYDPVKLTTTFFKSRWGNTV